MLFEIDRCIKKEDFSKAVEIARGGLPCMLYILRSKKVPPHYKKELIPVVYEMYRKNYPACQGQKEQHHSVILISKKGYHMISKTIRVLKTSGYNLQELAVQLLEIAEEKTHRDIPTILVVWLAEIARWNAHQLATVMLCKPQLKEFLNTRIKSSGSLETLLEITGLQPAGGNKNSGGNVCLTK